jgi:hypothetical protein
LIPVPQPFTNIMAYLAAPNTGAHGQILNNYIASGSEIYDTLAALSQGARAAVWLFSCSASLHLYDTGNLGHLRFVHCTCIQMA